MKGDSEAGLHQCKISSSLELQVEWERKLSVRNLEPS